MSETPTTTTSQKIIAKHLQFVLQYASYLYRSTFGAPPLRRRSILLVLLAFVSQYTSHLYCNAPPICIAVLSGNSWWLWSPGCSPPEPGWPLFSGPFQGGPEACSRLHAKVGEVWRRLANLKHSIRQHLPHIHQTSWTFLIFFFIFCFGGGEREEESEAQRGGGVTFIWK